MLLWLEENGVLKPEVENPAGKAGFTCKPVRRDPDSGQFVSPDEPIDPWERQFAELERLLWTDFT
jgi:hypothetical protein